MASEIEQIKQKIDLVELINTYVPLKKTGRNFKTLCPFHSEKTPSFIVSPERQIWHCFGCGLGGDHFAFLMKMENMDFGEALRELAQKTGVKLKSYRPSADEKQRQLFYEINHLAAEFYHYLLTSHQTGKKALAYLLKRGVNQESIIRFKLGFAPKMWDGLQRFLVNKKNYQPQDLANAGLTIRRAAVSGRQFYDRFRDRVIFPLADHRGNIRGFSGRVLASQAAALPADQQTAKYVNTPETLIYHKSDLLFGLNETKEAIKKKDLAVVVEGELDAISSIQAGVDNVVAIKGSALTPRQVQLLARFSQNLCLALDADVAGDQAARRGVEIADAAGLNIRVVAIKGGKDPDEIAQKDPQLWQQLVKKALPVYDYLIASALKRFGKQSAEAKKKVGQELIPALAKINDKIVQSHYLQVLAEKLDVAPAAVAQEVTKMEKKEAPVLPVSPKPVEVPLSRREILEEHLFGLVFQAEKWSFLTKKQVQKLVKTPRFLRIYQALVQYQKHFKTQDSQRLAKKLAPELKATFDRFYLLPLSDLVQDEDSFGKEMAKTLYQLERLDLHEKLATLSGEIKDLEKIKKPTQKDKSKLDQKQRAFRDWSQKLAETRQKE